MLLSIQYLLFFGEIRKQMIPILEHGRETVSYDIFQGIRLYHNKENESYPFHWHTAVEIIAPIENEYTVIIDSHQYILNPGDIGVILPGTLHELIAPEHGKRWILMFDYSLMGNVSSLETLIHSLGPFCDIRKDQDKELNEKLWGYIHRIIDEYENNVPFAGACLYSLLIRFLVSVGRINLEKRQNFSKKSSDKRNEYIGKFMDICNYISQHCTEDISPDLLAEMSGFSKFHFARLFKKFTNMSVHEYVTEQRIMVAERLLREPDLSIVDVAMKSGFNSLSTFNRIFRASKNCSPSDYRQMNKENGFTSKHSGELKRKNSVNFG